MSTKSDLIRLAGVIITRCPVSSYLEDMQLPYKIGVMNSRHIQRELDKLDSWLKDVAIKIRVAADSLEENSNSRTTQVKTPVSTPSPDGEILRDKPCDHPGCSSHVTHPCEGCGRQW